MANFQNLSQEQALDIIVKPIVKNSNLYAPISQDLSAMNIGTAPVGVNFNVLNGSYLNTITMPNSAIQLDATETQQKNDSYLPKTFFTSTVASWTLQNYAVNAKITKFNLDSLKIKMNTIGTFPAESTPLSDALVGLFQKVAKTDITRHAFHSEVGVNFATAYPSNIWGAGDTTATLPLKDGFMALIQDAVTAETVGNYDTTALNGSALTVAEVKTLLEAVVDNADYKLTSLFYDDIAIEQKPVFLVSTSVYKAYERLLQETGVSESFYFRGFDLDGQILPTVRALQYNHCLIIAAGDVFDDWSWTSAGLKNQHFAILTARDNLRLAYNFRINDDAGFLMERYGLQSGGDGIGMGMFFAMDFKIADATDSSLSVAGFTPAP
jgi:hypothetical protein